MKVEKKKQEQNKINEEILAANRNATLVIDQRKQKEKDEDEKIAVYIKDKAEKE